MTYENWLKYIENPAKEKCHSLKCMFEKKTWSHLQCRIKLVYYKLHVDRARRSAFSLGRIETVATKERRLITVWHLRKYRLIWNIVICRTNKKHKFQHYSLHLMYDTVYYELNLESILAPWCTEITTKLCRTECVVLLNYKHKKTTFFLFVSNSIIITIMPEISCRLI